MAEPTSAYDLTEVHNAATALAAASTDDEVLTAAYVTLAAFEKAGIFVWPISAYTANDIAERLGWSCPTAAAQAFFNEAKHVSFLSEMADAIAFNTDEDDPCYCDGSCRSE